MSKKSILFGSAAVAALAVIGSTVLPAGFSPVAPAAAAVNVSISIGTFYDDLQPHGAWTRYDGDYVFVPRGRRAGWRPYTEGHWVFTDLYGWMWVSDEPFGWATYHYGRWGFGNDIGWYWIPGTRWAPAWVYWRRGSDYTAWAPLPPLRRDRYSDFSINIGVGSIPDYYWAAVPTRGFLSINLSNELVRDDDERRRIIHRSEPRGGVRVRNNIIVNNVIDVDVIERETRQKVKRKRVVESDRRGRIIERNGDEIEVFSRPVKAERSARPKAVEDIEKVRSERKAERVRNREKVEDTKKLDRNKANVEGSESGDPAVNIVKPRDRTQANGKKKPQVNQQGNAGQADDVEVTAPAKKRLNANQEQKRKQQQIKAERRKAQQLNAKKNQNAKQRDNVQVNKRKQQQNQQQLKRQQKKKQPQEEENRNNGKKKAPQCDPQVQNCMP